MWRGVVSVILVLQVLGIVVADVKYGDDAVQSVQRVKRAPHYDYPDCPPDYYHHRHHPPFWPPPPPPPYWPPPPRQPPQRPEIIYVQEQKDRQNEAYRQPEPEPEPCATCQPTNNAVSNAKSDTGNAIAVAIAKASKPQ